MLNSANAKEILEGLGIQKICDKVEAVRESK